MSLEETTRIAGELLARLSAGPITTKLLRYLVPVSTLRLPVMSVRCRGSERGSDAAPRPIFSVMSAACSNLSASLAVLIKAHPAVAESDHFSGFNCGFGRFQCILDIQDQIGKPIMIPTAKLAIR
jgi:hypothetical protein